MSSTTCAFPSLKKNVTSEMIQNADFFPKWLCGHVSVMQASLDEE